MNKDITVTIEGLVGTGKSSVAAILHRSLIAHGIEVIWPEGVREANLGNLVDPSKSLQDFAPKITIVEKVRPFTIDERIGRVQARLHALGVRDVKLTLDPTAAEDATEEQNAKIDRTKADLVKLMEAYLDGKLTPLSIEGL